MTDAPRRRPQRAIMVWHGRIASRPAIMIGAGALAAPAVLWLLLFVLFPGLGLGVLAFMGRTPEGEVDPSLSVANLARATGMGSTGFSADNLMILARTLLVALATALGSIALALPLALWVAARPRSRRYLWLALIAVPMCTNIVIRSYAWMLLLGPGSPPARLAAALGLIDDGRALYPSLGAVILGMISAALPLAALPIYAAVERLDWSLVDAARDLYASRWRAFWHAVIMQITPALGVAFVLTFVPSLGMFVIPDLLGGAKHWLLGNLIQQQFGSSRDWAYGAALSLVLVLVIVPALLLVRARSEDAAPSAPDASAGGGGAARRASGPVVLGAVLSLLLLHAPLLGVAIFSFNSARVGLRWHGFTLEWYQAVLHDARLWELTRTTLALAGISAIIATLLGTLLALGLERAPWSRSVRRAADGALLVPVVMPDMLFAAGIVIATALLRRFSSAFDPGLMSMIIGHVSFQVAFVALVVRARLRAGSAQLEEAARDLYSSGWRLFARVTLPMMTPGVVAAALLAFTLSLDDFVISFFTASPDSTTLPIYIYAGVRRGLSPEIHALSTLLVLGTIVPVLVMERLLSTRNT